jgi:hypothetical protein
LRIGSRQGTAVSSPLVESFKSASSGRVLQTEHHAVSTLQAPSMRVSFRSSEISSGECRAFMCARPGLPSAGSLRDNKCLSIPARIK